MMSNFLHILDRRTGIVLKTICIACFCMLFAILTGNVISRLLGLFSMSWFDEIVELLFAWLVFLGAAALWREHDHFRVDWLDQKISALSMSRLINILLIVISLAFLVLMTWHGYQLVIRSQALTPIIQFPVKVLYASIPVAGFIMCIYSLRDLWRCLFNKDTPSTNLQMDDL
jgi:TRAP-type C4-dicarboxylate transport system permease small subunit